MDITIELFGRFRVLASNGADISPKGSKSCAIIALLATSKNLERGRLWLQDKLWSDRAPEQAASSLRQALTEIRKSFGDHRAVLITDRSSVRLDEVRVTIRDCPSTPDDEFLEGLDVRDSEFDAWLCAKRTSNDSCSSNQTSSTVLGPSYEASRIHQVVFEQESPSEPLLQNIEREFIELATRSLQENGDVAICSARSNEQAPDCILVSVKAFSVDGKKAILRVNVEEIAQNRLVWTQSVEQDLATSQAGPDLSMLGLTTRLVEVVGDTVAFGHLPTAYDRNANLLANVAVRKLFSIGPDDVALADRLLKQAFEIEKRGVFLAWRAQALTIQVVERFKDPAQELLDEAEDCCARALAMDPTNSNVLAAVANGRCILERNFVAAAELAQLAVQANPANPLAWWALSYSKSHFGRSEESKAAANVASKLAQNTRLRFWTDFQVQLGKVVAGDVESAISHGELSSALAPNFRPPLRYLLALYSVKGNVQAVDRTINRLRRLEPDFEISNMLKDPSYPISVMRISGLAGEFANNLR